MEFSTMTIEQLEARRAAIVTEMDADGADLDALEKEARGIKEELEKRKAAEQQKANIRSAVAAGAGTVIRVRQTEERRTPTMEEVRSSAEYCEAWKRYIINNDPTECRALLTTNASGGVPVPTILEDGIRTAWENDEIMSRVHRTYVRGNLKVAFELSADPAYVHTEGTTAPTEEALTFGVVELIPANVKKWIKVSDEVVAMAGPEFVEYIRDELTYRIVDEEASLAVGDIAGASTSNSSTAIGVPKVTAAPSVTVIPTAAANLSGRASNLVVIMNRLTEVEFIAAYAAGNFAVDPFAGMTKVYTSALPAYSTASDNAVYAIVGDLSAEQFNFPEGDGIAIKYDDVTLAEADMVKIIGRRYSAHKITRPGCFCNIAKPAAATT